jgi:hypothetical protein
MVMPCQTRLQFEIGNDDVGWMSLVFYVQNGLGPIDRNRIENRFPLARI